MLAFFGDRLIDEIFPYKAAKPAEVYTCMVAFVEEAVTKAVNNLENKLIRNDLNAIVEQIREVKDILTTAQRKNTQDALTMIQSKVIILDRDIKRAVDSIISTEDKAANLMPLYVLITTQALPLAEFVYTNYDAIFKDSTQGSKDLFKEKIKTDAERIMTKVNENFPKFEAAFILKRTNQVETTTTKLCGDKLQEGEDILTKPNYVRTEIMCRFKDTGANSDKERCGLPAGFSFDNDLSHVYKGNWQGLAPYYENSGLKTKSKWIYGRDAAKDAMEMMKRNAERFAKINFDVATAASVLWPAMMPGRDMRKTIKTSVVSSDFLPFGPAEFYCELGKTDQSNPEKCFPQLNSVAYIDRKMETFGGRPVTHNVLLKKSSLPSNEWAMSIDRSIDTEWRPKNNITKIEIASGAHIDGINVGIMDLPDTRMGNMGVGTLRTINTDNGKNPVVRIDIYAKKSFHGIGQITGLKFFQKNSPTVGIMTGQDLGCGDHGSYGFKGSAHYELDFTRWDGQVWLCGLKMFSTDHKSRVDAIGSRWCYNKFQLV